MPSPPWNLTCSGWKQHTTATSAADHHLFGANVSVLHGLAPPKPLQDGTISYEIKLTGELSTNLVSPGQPPNCCLLTATCSLQGCLSWPLYMGCLLSGLVVAVGGREDTPMAVKSTLWVISDCPPLLPLLVLAYGACEQARTQPHPTGALWSPPE